MSKFQSFLCTAGAWALALVGIIILLAILFSDFMAGCRESGWLWQKLF